MITLKSKTIESEEPNQICTCGWEQGDASDLHVLKRLSRIFAADM